MVFSILFLLVGFYALINGLYTIRRNPKADTSRLYLAVVVAILVWSFGLAVSISAANYDLSLLGRRIAAVGWGSVHAILLSFFIVLTGKGNLLRKKWLLALLYAPPILTICVFVLPLGIDETPYHLIHTASGWINMSGYGFWDWFYRVYYTIYLVIDLAMLGLWGIRSRDGQEKAQSRLLATALVVAMLLIAFTDVISDRSISTAFSLPQVEPLVLLLPIIAISYSIKRHGLMEPESIDEDELVLALSGSVRFKITLYAAIGFIVAVFVHIVFNFLFVQKFLLDELFGFSSMLLGTVLIMYILSRSRLGDETREMLITTVITLSIPLITLRFYETASVPAWTAVFSLFIVSLLFTRPTAQISILVSTVLTQLVLWAATPEVLVRVGTSDYILRIIVIGLVAFFGFSVIGLQAGRLKKIARQVRFQRMVADISTDFVNIRLENFDEKIDKLLANVGAFFHIDRSSVFLFNPQDDTMTYAHEWTGEGIASEIDTIQDVSLTSFPWWMNRMDRKGAVVVADVAALPQEAHVERGQLEAQGLKSVVSVPIERDDQVRGFLGLANVNSHRVWTDDEVEGLKTLSNLLSNAMIKTDAERDIRFMAYHDDLTELPNRRLFEHRLDDALGSARNDGCLVAVIFLDLDNFNLINDSLGHRNGDTLIREVAEKLVSSLRPSDTVGRFGGDEFLIEVGGVRDEGAVRSTAEKLIALFEQPFMLNGQEFFITASMGIALFPQNGEDGETLVKNAEIALLEAKSFSNNSYVFCTRGMMEEIDMRARLSNDLYRVLDHDELQLYYQPQVCLETGAICGVEALLRWRHPDLGMVPPDRFISLAERIGLINPIGEWILRTACAQNQAWHAQGMTNLRVAVNLSVNQFRDPDLVEKVGDILRETGLEPRYLEIEITESLAINDMDHVIEVLSSLKDRGVCLSIDDFGSGYSSLNRLKSLPIDRLKIDMRFIRGLEHDDRDRAIVAIVVNLGKNLGLRVLAEGVETESQLEFLVENGCDEVQGYYYYRPLPASEAEDALRENRDREDGDRTGR